MISFLHKTQRYSINLLPTATVLLAIFLSVIPYQISSSSLIMPFIVQMTIYYWSVYRPELLPYFIILLLGLFNDIIGNDILGSNALSFLLFQAMVISQRKFIVNRVFIVIWAGFAFCLLLMMSISYLFGIYNYPLPIVLSQWMLSVIAYVPIHWLLSKFKIY